LGTIPRANVPIRWFGSTINVVVQPTLQPSKLLGANLFNGTKLEIGIVDIQPMPLGVNVGARMAVTQHSLEPPGPIFGVVASIFQTLCPSHIRQAAHLTKGLVVGCFHNLPT
jgi:hypothetical protein